MTRDEGCPYPFEEPKSYVVEVGKAGCVCVTYMCIGVLTESQSATANDSVRVN